METVSVIVTHFLLLGHALVLSAPMAQPQRLIVSWF